MKNAFKIVIAEDDPNLSWVYQSLLEEAGYGIHAADNGVDALALVQQVFPDLVVTDVIIPGMDGFELAEAVRGNPATREIPIIFISGAAEPEDRERAARLGVNQYLSKPVQVMELLAAVKTALVAGQ
jgi:CheY-like chemotaxis protein